MKKKTYKRARQRGLLSVAEEKHIFFFCQGAVVAYSVVVNRHLFLPVFQVVGEWRFSKIHCDIFVTLDVMMCTASILNLCAISIDR